MRQPYEIRITRRADRQLARAAAWWDENRPSAPGAVDAEVTNACDLLRSTPRIGVPHRTRTGVRRVTLTRTRYYLYVRIDEPKHRVVIVALWHCSRGGEPPI